MSLYIDQRAGQGRTLWLDDLRLEEPGLVKPLRRDGCPPVVTSADGETAYAEDEDFLPVRDAKLGQVSYAGEYSFDRVGPPPQWTPDSRIKDRNPLLVNWYHPGLTQGGQVMCCRSDADVKALASPVEGPIPQPAIKLF